MGDTGFFLGQFELACRASKLACGNYVAAGHLFPRRVSLLSRGSRGMVPRKILKFDVAKRPFYAFLMLRASRFSSPGIPKNRYYSDHLPETLAEDEHFSDTG